MELIDTSYIGFYARFEAPDKATGSLLMGPDNIVGDRFTVFFKTEDGNVVAWVKNKFDKEVGFFDAETTRRLQLANAREQTIVALLSFVAYSDEPEPGFYWGEMAIFCYSPAYAAEMEPYISRCAAKIGDGIRPNIDLGQDAISKIFSESDWVPSDTVPFHKKENGMAILKNHQSVSEKMIEQGRARNKGCYVVSWLFIFVVIAAIVFGLHMAGLF